MADLEANKDLIRRAYEVCINQGQLDRASEFYAADYHGLLGSGLYEAHGFTGYQDSAKSTLAAFPDLRETPEELIAEGDRVWVRHRVSGTHTGGPFLGIAPTGKAVSFTVIDLYRLADGRIAEEFSQADIFGLLRQLGATITPPTVSSG